MSSKCTPPLSFVANGRAGSAFPPPLDPSDAPLGTEQPSFTQVACETLVDQCQQLDPLSAIDELPAIADTIDALAAASDTQLAAILEELDSVVGTGQPEQSYSDFAGAQPGAESLLGDVSGVALPALGQVPLVEPSGHATLTFGGPPETGGVAHAGQAPYVLHLPLAHAAAAVQAPRILSLSGPNPPFVGVAGVQQDPTAAGGHQWVALLTINPTAAGSFSATLAYDQVVTITGITGIEHVTLPFSVVAQ